MNLKQRAKKAYKKIKKVKCPAFPKEKITFNAKGFSHLFYKGRVKTFGRNTKEAQTRVKLLSRAVKLLKVMPIPQEEASYFLSKKKYKFWTFEGVVDNRRIKVVVRQIGNGNKHFWSVIPGWRRNRYGVRNSKSDLSKL